MIKSRNQDQDLRNDKLNVDAIQVIRIKIGIKILGMTK